MNTNISKLFDSENKIKYMDTSMFDVIPFEQLIIDTKAGKVTWQSGCQNKMNINYYYCLWEDSLFIIWKVLVNNGLGIVNLFVVYCDVEERVEKCSSYDYGDVLIDLYDSI